MKNILLFLATLLVLMVPGPISPAMSAAFTLDVAPPPPPAGVTIYPGVETTQVRMMAETVEINVAQNTPGEKPYARVRAMFTMRNLGSEVENLAVRFPLNFLFPDYMSDWEVCEFPLAYPEISDFSALVDGQPAPVTNTTQKIMDPGGAKGEVEVACWADFPVTFPPGKDVQIEVRYTAQGYPGVYGTNVYVQFNYVLVSGAGWKDTIGSAEIIFHAPYAFNNKTKLPHFPESGVARGSEIRWSFHNFEPDSNINVAVMDPGHWQMIEELIREVTEKPQDGAAWGRLAEAYKSAVMLDPVGWRGDEGGFEMYAKSATAYGRATTLRPDDAELRYGYAELLIWNAFYPTFGRPEEIYAGLVRGVEHLRRALEINPNHMRANALRKQLAEWPDAPQRIIDLSGPEADYLILTPGGETYTPMPTQTRTPFPPSLTPSPTWTRAPSRTPTQTVVATQNPSLVATVITEEVEKPAAGGRSPGICGAAMAPGLVAMAWVIRKRRRGAGAGEPAPEPGRE